MPKEATFAERQHAAREHDAWFRAEVEQGMREAGKPPPVRIPHEAIATKWRRKRAALVRRADQRGA